MNVQQQLDAFCAALGDGFAAMGSVAGAHQNTSRNWTVTLTSGTKVDVTIKQHRPKVHRRKP